MKVSVKWAQHYSGIDFSAMGTDVLLKKIGAQLGAVEEAIDWAPRYEGIVVVNVVSCERHANADKLNVCLVDDGSVTQNISRNEAGLVQVVCGAPNVRAGMTAAWIPPGVTVPSTLSKDPLVLDARDLRGEMSNGMLASAKELGINEEHDGILEIKAEDVGQELVKPGTPFGQLYGLNDVVIDCENKMFTHRPDCFGILGVARELAGISGQSFTSPDWYLQQPTFNSVNELPLDIKVEAPELVPRFMAVVIKNVTVGPSPIWMQAGLTRVGIRPITNIVDITNFVMQLTGQPLHAYDYDKLKANSNETPMLIARKSREGETLNLLNGKSLTTKDDSTILIATDKTPVGVGGVMGGADTEVDASTKTIVLEAANFDMYNIRRTSMKYGLFTDAVTRFNKGQSSLQNDRILSYAMQQIAELAGGAQASEVRDLYSTQREQKPVSVSVEFINARLGSALSATDMQRLLKNVEIAVEVQGDQLVVTPPFWRTDLEIGEDIVEEIGRLYGFDKLPIVLPKRTISPAKKNPMLELKSRIRATLSEAGANEVLTYSFVHGKLITNAGQSIEQAYSLSNALSPDLQYYRLTLTPSLLSKVHGNVKAGFDSFALFEMSKTHVKMHGMNAEQLPDELPMLAMVYAASDKSTATTKGAAFYNAKAQLDFLAKKLGTRFIYAPFEADPKLEVTKPYDWKRSALVTEASTGTFIGMVGEFTQEVRQNFKLPHHTAGFEVGLPALLEVASSKTSYTPLSRFPSTSQDVTFVIAGTNLYQDLVLRVTSALKAASAPHGYEATQELLDIYQKEETTKSITFRFTVTHPQRTLTTSEVNQLLSEVVNEVHGK